MSHCIERGCDELAIARGLCRRHYRAWYRNHPDEVNPNRDRRDPIELFASHVDASGDCWVWTGTTIRNTRYGLFSHLGRNYPAHRWLWEHLYGALASSEELDHLCRNRPCVNPLHLEPVTRLVNVHRSTTPGMLVVRSGVCSRGHSMDDAYEGKNGRRCRTCTNERNLRYWRERQANGATA
jgi:hypothetical protein